MSDLQKATDDQLVLAYFRLNSVWKVGAEFGMSGQQVYSRLSKYDAVHKVKDEFTLNQQVAIVEVYRTGFQRGDGVLDSLAKLFGKSKQNICRWARRNGLTDRSRPVSDFQAKKQGEKVRLWISENGHPRGALGMRHTPEVKRRLSEIGTQLAASRSAKDEAARVLKGLKTKEANGTLDRDRGNTSWKSGWRVIGGKRKYYRSRWEANYARYLELLRKGKHIAGWEHEPETFWFEAIRRGSRSYLPDFRVTRIDGGVYYVEVKGYMDQRSKTKIKRMKKYHPNIELVVVDAVAYRQLARNASALIKEWE